MAANLFDLEGKNIVVMGGAGGMGSSVAKGLCEYGGNLALCDITAHSLEKAAAYVKGDCDREVRTYVATATVERDVEHLVQDIVRRHGPRRCARERAGLQRQERGHAVSRWTSGTSSSP